MGDDRIVDGLAFAMVDGELVFDPAGLPVDYRVGGIDHRRAAVEILRAGITPRESLKMSIDLDRLVMVVNDPDLGVVAEVPAYRVLSFAPDQLRPFIAHAIEHSVPEALHEAVLAEINGFRSDIDDDPWSTHVKVAVNLGHDPTHRMLIASIHRGNLVDIWPHDDDGTFVE